MFGLLANRNKQRVPVHAHDHRHVFQVRVVRAVKGLIRRRNGKDVPSCSCGKKAYLFPNRQRKIFYNKSFADLMKEYVIEQLSTVSEKRRRFARDSTRHSRRKCRKASSVRAPVSE